jgi:four helix bundle protein
MRVRGVRRFCVLRADRLCWNFRSAPRFGQNGFGFQSGIPLLFNRVNRYQDFKAWQLSAELNTKIFRLTSTPPSYLDFSYRDNIRDAADSAQRNFPEGFGRFAPGDFAHFLDHSRASLLEVKNELAVGFDRGYFRAEDVEDATILVKRALKALSGLQQYLRYPRTFNEPLSSTAAQRQISSSSPAECVPRESCPSRCCSTTIRPRCPRARQCTVSR